MCRLHHSVFSFVRENVSGSGNRFDSTHPEVSRQDVVGGDHHVLRGQKRLAPVAIGAVIQIHVKLHISPHMLLKLVLHKHTQMRKMNKICISLLQGEKYKNKY